MSSLRRRISIGVIGITSVVVLVAALGIWMATRSVLLNGVDGELSQRIERMRRMDAMPMPSGWRHRMPGPPPPESKEHTDPKRLFQVLRVEDGREIGRSASLPEGDGLGSGEDPATVMLSDGRRVRSSGARLGHLPPFMENGGEMRDQPIIVRIGIDLDQVDAELIRMARMLAALWIAATVLAVASVLLLGSAILRPVRELGDAIDRLGPDDLTARISVTTGPDEVRGMVQRLNGLLGRLEQAFRREQATIASIAHELRTPVAALRSDIEFRLLASPGADEAAVLRSNLKTVERMQAMVTNLLLLARLESGKEIMPREAVDVAILVEDAMEAWGERAAASGRRLQSSLPEFAQVEGSAVHLRLVLDNLLGNAVDHGIAGDIQVGLEQVTGSWRLRVENPCTGNVDVAQLGEAFYRGDAARSGGDHCGLGLALCRRLARVSGFRFQAMVEGGRFIAVLDMPVKEG